MFKVGEMMRLAHHLKDKTTVQLLALKHKAAGVMMDFYNKKIGEQSYWKAVLCSELAEKILSFRDVTIEDNEAYEWWLEDHK